MTRVRRRVASIAVVMGSLAGLATTIAPAADAARLPLSSPRWQACTPTLDGVRTTVTASQRTVTMVRRNGSTTARVSMWVRTNTACSFVRLFLTTTGRIGYAGMADGATRQQGSGTTPIGTYTMTEAFGLAARPATAMPYRRVGPDDWWVQDRQSAFYNSYRSGAQGGFRTGLPGSDPDSSEHLADYQTQYRYAVVINFNRSPDPLTIGRGSGIFLHVAGRGATAGCVAVTATHMRTVLAYLRPGDGITISG